MSIFVVAPFRHRGLNIFRIFCVSLKLFYIVVKPKIVACPARSILNSNVLYVTFGKKTLLYIWTLFQCLAWSARSSMSRCVGTTGRRTATTASLLLPAPASSTPAPARKMTTSHSPSGKEVQQHLLSRILSAKINNSCIQYITKGNRFYQPIP